MDTPVQGHLAGTVCRCRGTNTVSILTLWTLFFTSWEHHLCFPDYIVSSSKAKMCQLFDKNQNAECPGKSLKQLVFKLEEVHMEEWSVGVTLCMSIRKSKLAILLGHTSPHRFFYTQNSFIAKVIILQLSIELLVTIVHSTLHKTTNPPECSRPSHPISRGY